jgi:AcrR family transcriptional regulator
MSYRTTPTDETDQRILTAARQLLDTNPEAAFTMDELAEASGISRATLYRRFGSRTALLQATAAEHGLDIDELAAPAIRERILEATRQALAQAGSVNFTIEQVAAEAGVGVATIYRHFGNKDSLLKALSDRLHPRRAAMQMLEQASGNLGTDLLRFASDALRFMYEYRDMAPVYFSGDSKIQDIFKTLRGDQNRTIDTLSRYLETQIQAGFIPTYQNAFDLATAFVGMLVGFAFIRASYTDDPLTPEQAAQTIVRIFLSGILDEETP